MAIELSTIVNYLLIAFVGFVFVMWFVKQVQTVWKGKDDKKEEPAKKRTEERIL